MDRRWAYKISSEAKVKLAEVVHYPHRPLNSSVKHEQSIVPHTHSSQSQSCRSKPLGISAPSIVLDPRRLSRHPIRCKRWHNPDQVQPIPIRFDAATRQRQDISSSSMLEQQVRVAQDPIKPPWLPFTERNVDPCTFEPSAKEITAGWIRVVVTVVTVRNCP
jgi:hypothetical protein